MPSGLLCPSLLFTVLLHTWHSHSSLFCHNLLYVFHNHNDLFLVKIEPKEVNEMSTHCRSSRNEEGGGLRVASMAALSSGDWNLCLPRKRLRCCGEGEYLPLASTNEVIAEVKIVRTLHFHIKSTHKLNTIGENRDSRATRQAVVYSQWSNHPKLTLSCLYLKQHHQRHTHFPRPNTKGGY